MQKLRKRIDKRRGFTYDKLRKRNKRLFEGDVIKSESLLRMRKMCIRDRLSTMQIHELLLSRINTPFGSACPPTGKPYLTVFIINHYTSERYLNPH